MGARPERAAAASKDASPAADPALSARDEGILSFERQWWKHAGAKEEAIRSEFGLSATRYYQLLNAVLDQPGAMMSDPMLVKRLQRMRDDRTAARSSRTRGTAGPTSDQ